jgi:hypothetical protein
MGIDMQIVTPPLPIATTATFSPQAITQALPQVQALASAPITQRAVAPPPKTERGNRFRGNEEKAKDGEDEALRETEGDRGHLVNTKA